MLIKIVRELKIIEDGEEIKLLFSFGYLKILKINVLKLYMDSKMFTEDGEEIRVPFFF